MLTAGFVDKFILSKIDKIQFYAIEPADRIEPKVQNSFRKR